MVKMWTDVRFMSFKIWLGLFLCVLGRHKWYSLRGCTGYGQQYNERCSKCDEPRRNEYYYKYNNFSLKEKKQCKGE